MKRMSGAEALEFKARWQFIKSFISEEIRNTSPDVKLQQLRTLFASGHLFQSAETDKEVDEVRARRVLLKSKFHG
jgi:hypothetical protein